MQPLDLTCPNCLYRFDLLSGLQNAEQREYITLLIASKLSSDEMALLFRYLAFFKPQKYSMSFKALTSRTQELLERMSTARVSRNGNVRVAPKALWLECIKSLIETKPEALTNSPPKTHAYLDQMVFNRAEAAAARAEAKAIDAQRNRTPATCEALKDEETYGSNLKSMRELLNNIPGPGKVEVSE